MMRWPSAICVVFALGAGAGAVGQPPAAPRPMPAHAQSTTPPAAADAGSVEAAQAVIGRTCLGCHNNRTRNGNLSFDGFTVATAAQHADVAERMIRKLRAGQMPPAGSRRPDEACAHRARGRPRSAGRRAARRRRRRAAGRSSASTASSTRDAVRDLLELDINAGDYLPLDPKSANFDNIADAQLLSPTLMQAYLTAAAEISRLAVGDRNATAREITYRVSRWTSQREHVEGAPYGTRGGLSVEHTFPADGEYRFRDVLLPRDHRRPVRQRARRAAHGGGAGADRGLRRRRPRGAARSRPLDEHLGSRTASTSRREPIAITAGPHQVSAAFIRRMEGPVQDLITPLEWSLASTSIADAYGFTTLPHLRDMAIVGPTTTTGISDDAEPRAHLLVPRHRQRLAADRVRARNRPAPRLAGVPPSGGGARRQGADDALSAGGAPRAASSRASAWRSRASSRARASCSASRSGRRRSRNGQVYRLSDLDLASRLSFFLWATGPDAELMRLAGAGRLSAPATLEQQVRRMLGRSPRRRARQRVSPRSGCACRTWISSIPTCASIPITTISSSARCGKETELFFQDIVRADRSVLTLFSADYSFLNERLARHYDIPHVVGNEFRKVAYPDGRRRGLLGHGSILTLTSVADRTSPVLRGKWVMEVLLGTPPPPPPPDVPDLDATADAEDGRLRTVRERLEQHRANPACTLVSPHDGPHRPGPREF